MQAPVVMSHSYNIELLQTQAIHMSRPFGPTPMLHVPPGSNQLRPVENQLGEVGAALFWHLPLLPVHRPLHEGGVVHEAPQVDSSSDCGGNQQQP